MSLKAKLAAVKKRLDVANAAKALVDKYPPQGVVDAINNLTRLAFAALETGIEPPELTAILDDDPPGSREFLERAMPGAIACVEREMKAQEVRSVHAVQTT